ncbi:MAG TPA: GGDEF domain-containing protein [bacterium]|nr:GGDEF domain-containing protein [bacterium]
MGDQESPRHALPEISVVKRRAYLVAMLAGMGGGLLEWVDRTPSSGITSPILLLWAIAWTWALWRNHLTVVRFELGSFVLLAFFTGAKFVDALWTSDNLAAAHQALLASGYAWLVVLAIVAFLFFDARTGLWTTAAITAVLAAVGVARFLDGGASIGDLAGFLDFERFMLYIGTVVAMLYALAFVKTHLAEAHELTEQLTQLAYLDELTGVANRRHLAETLDVEIARAARYAHPLSIIQFDLDRFKQLNDTYGHAAGDAVLKETVRRMRRQLRLGDLLGRWGGEEFLVLLPETGLSNALAVADRMRRAMGVRYFERVGRVTASFGVTTLHPGDTAASVVERTDEALYQAKAEGRDRVAVVTDDREPEPRGARPAEPAPLQRGAS